MKTKTKPVAGGNLTTGKAAARPKSPTAKAAVKQGAPGTGQVLKELKSLAKELNKAAEGIGKRTPGDPKDISAILGNVERMTAEAANKSLAEAEMAKQILASAHDCLGKDWSRKEINAHLEGIGAHLTNIIVAQEFQDLAGQAIRKAMKKLVGAIVVETAAGDDRKLSQNEVDSLLKDLML
jgi:chemotaxis regulatin CheY-phosphate phosphatase CheZ